MGYIGIFPTTMKLKPTDFRVIEGFSPTICNFAEACRHKWKFRYNPRVNTGDTVETGGKRSLGNMRRQLQRQFPYSVGPSCSGLTDSAG